MGARVHYPPDRTMRPLTLSAVALLLACNRAPEEPHTVPTPTTATPAPPESGRAPDRVGARHVLIMHRGSERVPPTVTRTREEARTRAQEVLARARAGNDFAALARQYSDEPGAATSGGDLGVFGHGQMVPEFDRAAFALAPGAISDVIETSFGFHVIQRTR